MKMDMEKKTTKKIRDMKPKITRDTNIMLIVNEYPDAIDVLTAFGLHCTTCIASAFDTVYTGAKMHGMDDDEIDEMIKEANLVLDKDELF